MEKISETIVIKDDPKTAFLFLENGFELIDGQTEGNTGFYSYYDIDSIALNKVWFPKVARLLRIITWILNGVPYFPDAESYKKANLIIDLKGAKFKMWLTDSRMAGKAKRVVKLLEEKAELNKKFN